MKTLKSLLLAALLAVMITPVFARPLIGVNIDVQGDDPHGSLALGSQYIDAITSAGGLPVILPPVVNDSAAIDRYIDLCDGFLMTGGRDINPLRYGATTVTEHVNLVNPRRENFDIPLIQAALAANKPVLGICLGSQELNVAAGGSLFQDLPTETSSSISHRPGTAQPSHLVDITTGTRLHDMLGTTTLTVNSMHHQACDRLGANVLVMATAPDGVVEAFEVSSHTYAVGIQWHPEALTEIPEHLRIYQSLVEAAEKAKAQREK